MGLWAGVGVGMAVQGHQAVHVARHGAVGRVHVGVDRAGLHVVHRDATRAQVARQALGQAHDGGLAHAVHAESGPWHTVGVGAADGDHAAIGAALAHVAHGGLGGHKHGAHVHIERVVKVGQRKAADITAREMKYITSLTTDLKNICTALANSWLPSGVDYANKVLTAGASGNTLYPKKQDVFIAIVDGMAGICDEVGNGKMKEPFDLKDGTKVESPFSGNSLTDFRNNLQGAYDVYTGKIAWARPAA